MRNRQRVKEQFEELLRQYESGQLDRAALVEQAITLAIPEKTVTEHQRMVAALCKVMGQDVNLMFARYARLATTLLAGGYTVNLIETEYGSDGGYYKNDWRGQRGSLPTEFSIKETIARAAKGWTLIQEGRNFENGTYRPNSQKYIAGNEVGTDARAEAERLASL